MSDTVDPNTGNQTILGVGVADLLRMSPPPVRPTPITSAGEIDCEPNVVVTEVSEAVATANEGHASSKRSSWMVAGIATVAALGASIGIGLGVRSWMASDDESTRSAAVDKATSSQVVAKTAVSAAPAVAALPAKSSVERAKPGTSKSRISIGDGSCAVRVEANGGGRVMVDDQPVGEAPVEVSGLWCGRKVSVRVERAGFVTWNKSIAPQEGRLSRLVAGLQRQPSTNASEPLGIYDRDSQPISVQPRQEARRSHTVWMRPGLSGDINK